MKPNSKSPEDFLDYYREDGLKNTNSYQYRLKDYYKYNDRGSDLDPSRRMKDRSEERLREKCYSYLKKG